MSIAAKFNRFDRKKLLWPHEVWPDVFGDAVKDNPEFADALAHLMFNLLEPMVKRPGDIEKVCNTLKECIEWVYPYTRAHKAAFKAYLMKLERMMEVEDNPEDLMNQAIARATRPKSRNSHRR